jgi:multiple sugar transport system permease protein
MGWLFAAPLLMVFGVYFVYAIVRSIWMSFTNYQFASSEAAQFIGLRNYARVLEDSTATSGFFKAGYFTLLYYIGGFLLPLVVALALDRVRNAKVAGVYRVLLYIPAVVPAPLIYRLWRWMYAPSIGLINYIGYDLLHLFPGQPNWLSDSQLVLPSLVFIYWWWSIGLMTIFFLVGLAAIPEELYEAARLDGANELQIVRHVSLPLLKGTIMVWAILRIAVFSIAEPMLVLWGIGTYGGRGVPNEVRTWAWHAYTLGFTRGKLPMGYATAIGWLGALVMIVMALLIRRFLLEKE